MLNTRKLLYILPDVAYIAELLPTKKEHTFSVQSFRQINGEFLNEDDDLIAENIDKLLSKLDPDTYHLVLPDFLFTNTILEIKETQENKVKDYIKDSLLPSLGLEKNTHEISTFVLTQYGNVTKIQLTALEKSVLDPLVTASQEHRVVIENISPLSWTIKSIISLEPSISVIQIGSIVYVAEHYIGVDQCTMAQVTEIENVEETIKTLKGAQPSIQTIYLLTNALVEEKLKEKVSKTLPIQQLATFKDEETQMPSYVKQIIESGMKTLDIADFPVPQFTLPKTVSGVVKTKTEKAEPEVAPAIIDKPRALNVFETTEDEEPGEDDTPLPTPVASPITPAVPNLPELDTAPLPEPSTESDETKEEPSKPEPIKEAAITDEESAPEPAKETEKLDLKEESNVDEPDLSLFAPPGSPTTSSPALDEVPRFDTVKVSPTIKSEEPEVSMDTFDTSNTTSSRPIIKNKAEGNNLVKGLVVLTATLAITMAIGAGIGFAVLRLTNSTDSQVATTPTASPSPASSPVPSPSPSPSPAAIDKSELKILVVNATTTPGYAGSTRSKLVAAEYGTVTAANAKGEYEPGTYVLMKTQDQALISALQTDSGLTLSFETGVATEDPRDEYDAVIVLAE